MKARLFLGVRVGSEHQQGLKKAELKWTTHQEKTYVGYLVAPQTTLEELTTLEEQLMKQLSEFCPDARFPAPLLFSELLIG